MSVDIILAEALYGHFLFGSNVNSLACNNNIVKAIYISKWAVYYLNSRRANKFIKFIL